MIERTRSHLLRDLENLRVTQLTLTDRLRRILTAMALSEEVTADIHHRLGVLDNPPNGHHRAAVAAAETAQTYRQLLSRLVNPADDPPQAAAASENRR